MESLNKLIKDSEIESNNHKLYKQIDRFHKRLKELVVEIELEFNYPITDTNTEIQVKEWIKEVENYLKDYRTKFISDSNWINSAIKWIENFDKLKAVMSSEETKRIRNIRKELQQNSSLLLAQIRSIDTILNVLQNPLKIEIPLIEPQTESVTSLPKEDTLISQTNKMESRMPPMITFSTIPATIPPPLRPLSLPPPRFIDQTIPTVNSQISQQQSKEAPPRLRPPPPPPPPPPSSSQSTLSNIKQTKH